MKKNHPLHILLSLTIIALFVGAAPAQAGHWGAPGMDGPDAGPWQRGPQGDDDLDLFCRCPDLTDAQIEELKALRSRFLDETRDLRQEMRQRRLSLAAELAKKIPDAQAAMEIQNELSGLMGTMAQKRLENLLEAKKIAPDLDLGCRLLRHHGGFGPHPAP